LCLSPAFSRHSVCSTPPKELKTFSSAALSGPRYAGHSPPADQLDACLQGRRQSSGGRTVGEPTRIPISNVPRPCPAPSPRGGRVFSSLPPSTCDDDTSVSLYLTPVKQRPRCDTSPGNRSFLSPRAPQPRLLSDAVFEATRLVLFYSARPLPNL